MRSHTAYIRMNTDKKKEIINITSQVEEEVEKSGIVEGIVLANSMHITSSVFVNDENLFNVLFGILRYPQNEC